MKSDIIWTSIYHDQLRVSIFLYVRTNPLVLS